MWGWFLGVAFLLGLGSAEIAPKNRFGSVVLAILAIGSLALAAVFGFRTL